MSRAVSRPDRARGQANEEDEYEENVDRILAGLSMARRLKGIPPTKRLVDLDRDHRALALPIEVLRVLPEDYLRTLSPEIQAELRRRLAQSGH